MQNVLNRRAIEVRDVKQSPLDICLDIWMRWSSRCDLDLGWCGRSAILAGDGAASSDQLYDRMDTRVAEAVDTMVDGLKLQHSWAIKKRCGIATAWNFPRLDFDKALGDAEIELEKKLKINLATANFFF